MIGIIAIIAVIGFIATRQVAAGPPDTGSNGDGVGDDARDAFCDIVGQGAEAAESSQTGAPPTTTAGDTSNLCDKVFGSLETFVVDGLNPVLQATLGPLVEAVGLASTGSILTNEKITGAKVKACIEKLRSNVTNVGQDFVIWVKGNHDCKLEVRAGLRREVAKSTDVRMFHLVAWAGDSRPGIKGELSAFEHNAIENAIVVNASRAAAYQRLDWYRYRIRQYMDAEGVDVGNAITLIKERRFPNSMGDKSMISLRTRLAEEFPGLDPAAIFSASYETAVAKGFQKVWKDQHKIGGKPVSEAATNTVNAGPVCGVIVKREKGKAAEIPVNFPKAGVTVPTA